MTENTKTTDKTFLESSSFATYSEMPAESQLIDDFEASKKPVRVNFSKPSASAQKKYLNAVFRKTVAKVAQARYSFDHAITTVCYTALCKAYSEKSPWIVDTTLTALQTEGRLSPDEMKKVVAYFRAAGFDITSGIYTCKAIRDYSLQSQMVEKMSGVYVLSFKIKREESDGSKTLADGDIAKRAREALNRAHDSAKKNAEKAQKEGNKEAETFFNKERALNTATKDILMLLKDCEDPVKVVEEFKAWFESTHAKELNAK